MRERLLTDIFKAGIHVPVENSEEVVSALLPHNSATSAYRFTSPTWKEFAQINGYYVIVARITWDRPGTDTIRYVIVAGCAQSANLVDPGVVPGTETPGDWVRGYIYNRNGK